MSRLVINAFICSLCLTTASCSRLPKITVDAQAVDVSGNPIEGAEYIISFPWSADRGESERGLTDDEGKCSFTGKVADQFFVKFEKEGYYSSKIWDNAHIWRDGRTRYFDQNVTLVLREKRNPIPMYAMANQFIIFPVLDTPVGFDFKEGDWVAPYGGGETVDILLECNSEYKSANEFHFRMVASFPNEGDGMIQFEPTAEEKQSEFISPYLAPTDGYAATKEWISYRKPVPVKDKQLSGNEVEIRNDNGSTRWPSETNYILRTRTVLDGEGNVLRSNYTKIYGEMAVGNKHFRVNSFYFNPNINDRNLEYKVGSNLSERSDSRFRPANP